LRTAQFNIWLDVTEANRVRPAFTPRAGAVPVDMQNAVIQIDKMPLEALQRSSAFRSAKAI